MTGASLPAEPVGGACPVCGGAGGREYRANAVPFMFWCPTCTLLWQPANRTQSGRPERYDESYYGAWGELSEARAAKLHTFERVLRLLERHTEPGPLLDVGTALGFLLEQARRRGWDPWGVEVSPFAAGEAKAKLGEDRVHLGTLDTAPWEPESFRAIALVDVLEHLPDPLAALRRCRELLQPGGFLLVATPHVGCLSERLMGRQWFQLKEEHLQLFSRQALREALGRAGLQMVAHYPMTKTLTLSYLAHHFAAYPRRVITPTLRVLCRCAGPLSRWRIPMWTGEQLAIAGKPAAEDRPGNPARQEGRADVGRT